MTQMLQQTAQMLVFVAVVAALVLAARHPDDRHRAVGVPRDWRHGPDLWLRIWPH